MNHSKPPHEEIRIGVLAMMIACVIAANEITEGGFTGWAGSYAYWITRILIEASLFMAALYSVENFARDKLAGPLIYASAIVISLLPFALAITSFDLIIGLPELGLNSVAGPSGSRLPAFGRELIYLSDNHATLCALLLLPRLFQHVESVPPTETAAATEPLPVVQTAETAGFFDTIDPPLTGRIYWVEAQEHYVRVTTSSESRMVLLRFSDAVRELPASTGMQVHRSHWVAYADLKELQRDGQNLKLKLRSGELIPVSRSFRQQVEEKIQALNPA